MQNWRIISTAEPFFFQGDSTGCLLVHGFTGTPKEMRWMGEYLASQAGHTVLGVRLTGHATMMEDMARTRWQDWLVSVEDGLSLLQGVCTRIFVMGLSMGGALALLAANRYPIAGVVSMAAPYDVPADWRLNVFGMMKFIKPGIAKGPSDWQNLEAKARHIAYRAYPTTSVIELRKLLAEMRSGLPDIAIPVLLIHSRQDKSVLPKNMESIYARLGTKEKEMLWLDHSGHVVTCEPDRELVFNAAAKFVQRVNQMND